MTTIDQTAKVEFTLLEVFALLGFCGDAKLAGVMTTETTDSAIAKLMQIVENFVEYLKDKK